jgi:hypothetical protein
MTAVKRISCILTASVLVLVLLVQANPDPASLQ